MKLALVMVMLAACNPFKEGSISGKVESKGLLGDWVLDSGKCHSGQRENYFGAIAWGPEGSGIAIKLVKDPTKGWIAMVNDAKTCKTGGSDCKALHFTAESCAKLKVAIEPTNTTINDIKVVEGFVELDCVEGANSLKGRLDLTYCH
jgi:hypothetical protein